MIDFTPVIGDIKGGVEGAEVIFEELGKDDPNFLLIGVVGGAGVVGLIPGVGDAAQKLIMQGARRFRKTELNPELMEILTPKDQETVQVLTKNTLPTPETDGERLADEVATMLREGKAGDITEEMLETAGNDFHTRLTQNYIDGNVGMDLPMDWESTMARSADQGLTETRYHGSNVKDIPFFKGKLIKQGYAPSEQTGMFNTDDPFKAFSYEGKNGETYSLLMRPLPEDTPRVDVEGANWSNLDEPSMDYNKNQLSPDVRQGPRMGRQAQPLDEYLQEQTGNLTSDMFMRKASQLGYPGATIENVVDRGPSTPTRFSKEEGLKARNLASQPSQTQARTDTTGIRSVGARFDPRLTGLKNINMAQGGLTSMNNQTQMAFALGGEAETVDPVSGNDVPPGSLPEEVRDDIDAKLSEGEYVVPADVVRFFGVKYFEDLRAEAKMGLQQMDADGRIGGEPIDSPQTELSDKDLDEIIRQAAQQEQQQQQPMMANKGGVVGYQSGGYEFPDYTTKPRFVGQSVFGINPIYQDTSEEDKKSAADKIIEDAKTEVLPVCPPGQTYDKSRQMCMPDNTDDSNDPDPDIDPDASKTSTTWGINKATGAAIDFSSADALAKYSKSFNTPFADGYATDKSVLAGLAAISPGIALATGLVGGFDETTDLAAMKASRISAAIYGHNELAETIGEDIEKYEKKTGDGLGSKSLGIGQGYDWSALANGITRKEVKTFMDLYEEVYSPGGTKTQEDITSLEKLRAKLLEKSKAARPGQRNQATANKQALASIAKTKAYLEEQGEGEGNITPGSLPSRQSKRGATVTTTSPAPSIEDFRNNNDDSNDIGDGGSVAADFTNTGPDFTGSGGIYQTGGLVQRRKKKK